jgi:hypothetical protein
MDMQKTGILERKALILLSLTILTLILTAALATPTLAKKDKEENVEFKVVGITVDEKGKIWVTVEIYVNGVLKATVTFDPPGGTPGFPDE